MASQLTDTLPHHDLQEKEHKKRTLVVGASPNPSRYSYKAAHLLQEHGHPIIPLSIKRGEVANRKILDIREKPQIDHIHTITLYIGSRHQPNWINYLLSLKPKRIIFNPGTENPVFEGAARNQGIEVLEACTLVMLSLGQY